MKKLPFGVTILLRWGASSLGNYDPISRQRNGLETSGKHSPVTCRRIPEAWVEASWNVMAHEQKPDFVFLRNGRVQLNRRVRQFSRLLAADVGASVVVMLDTPCCEVVRRVLATQSIRQFPLNFPSRASPCAITLQLDSTSSAPLRELKIPKLFIVLIISYSCKIIYLFIHSFIRRLSCDKSKASPKASSPHIAI
jgi:hypothetical protein